MTTNPPLKLPLSVLMLILAPVENEGVHECLHLAPWELDPRFPSKPRRVASYTRLAHWLLAIGGVVSPRLSDNLFAYC